MGQLSSKLRDVALSQGPGLTFWCPGCKSAHTVSVGTNGWAWNQDAERPTFSPSVLVTYDGADAGQNGAPPARCHSFVGDSDGSMPGFIVFLGDCTHALAGQTVPLPDYPNRSKEPTE